MYYLSIKSAWIEQLSKGYPWVYTPAIASKTMATSGELVYLVDNKRRPFAIGYYNAQSKLACRILTLNPNEQINEDFFAKRLNYALTLRERHFTTPYYRLIHAEGDGLPGLVIDRFKDIFVCQTSTAGMEKLKPVWLAALQTLFSPQRIIFRDNVPAREKEGLTLSVSASTGDVTEWIPLEENGVIFYADPGEGQKTGWFYDQRANRGWVAKQTKRKTVLDLYTYSGGFGLTAAFHGAKHVTLVDASQKALDIAQFAANANQLSHCDFIKADVFDLLPQLHEQGRTFEVVVADPPAFVKQIQHKGPALRGYQKLAKQAAQVVAPKGILFIASCSHHANMEEFRKMVETGIAKAGRIATFLYKKGADKDHPIHPLLPQTHYLKALAFRLD